VVIYVPSVYINLSAAELAGLFQPGCLLRRLGDFSCLWDPERGPAAHPCQVPALDQQQQAAPGSRRPLAQPRQRRSWPRGPHGPPGSPRPPTPGGEGSEVAAGKQALGHKRPSPTLLPGFVLLLLRQLKWLFIIYSSPRALFPSLLPCLPWKEAAFSCRRQMLPTRLQILVAWLGWLPLRGGMEGC